MGGAGDGDRGDGREEVCPGPHPQCQGCLGHKEAVKETLYVPASGPARGVAAPHCCWYCKGRGYYCHATPRCHRPHDAPQ